MAEIKERKTKIEEKIKNNVLKQLKMNEDDLDKAVENLNIWLQYQQHLPHKIDSRILKAMIVCCKSAELAKEKLEKYFLARISYNAELAYLNPFKIRWECIQPMAYLPDLTPEGNIVLFLTMPDLKQTPQFDFIESIRYMSMMAEYIVRERPYVTGKICITDLKNLSMKLLTKLPIENVSNALGIFDAYPFEMTAVYNFNTPKIADVLQKTILKPIMKDGLYNLITSYTSDETVLSSIIPLDIIPSDFGGNGPSMKKIMDDWKVKLEGASAIICEECSLLPDESKIPKKKLNSLNETSGTFRKLNLD